MRMKIFAVIFFMMGVASTCLAMDRYEKMIQGTWQYSQSDGRGLGMSLQWTFNRGKYELKGYPQLLQTGRYRVLEGKGSTMQLLLYDKKGDLPPEDRKISVTINKAEHTLMIDHQGPWRKVP